MERSEFRFEENTFFCVCVCVLWFCLECEIVCVLRRFSQVAAVSPLATAHLKHFSKRRKTAKSYYRLTTPIVKDQPFAIQN